MTDKVIDIKEVRDERDYRTFKQKFRDGFNGFVEFVEAHPLVSICLATSAVKIVTLAVQGTCKIITAKQDAAMANTIYDHSLNTRWQLRRQLTNDENMELERRKNNGENLGDILDSMRLLR